MAFRKRGSVKRRMVGETLSRLSNRHTVQKSKAACMCSLLEVGLLFGPDENKKDDVSSNFIFRGGYKRGGGMFETLAISLYVA